MQRTAVNPWDWSLRFGYSQGQIVTGHARQLICAGQTSVDASGHPQYPGDMRRQIALALDNLEAVLASGGMTFDNVTKLGIYATDVDEALANFDLVAQRFGSVPPPMTVLGVTRLAIPNLMFEIEATAVD